MYHPFFLVSLLVGLMAGGVAALEPRDPSKTFSLTVTEKLGHSRNFVRDWAAAHQKWGVPEKVSSMFSQADTGDYVHNWVF